MVLNLKKQTLVLLFLAGMIGHTFMHSAMAKECKYSDNEHGALMIHTERAAIDLVSVQEACSAALGINVFSKADAFAKTDAMLKQTLLTMGISDKGATEITVLRRITIRTDVKQESKLRLDTNRCAYDENIALNNWMRARAKLENAVCK